VLLALTNPIKDAIIKHAAENYAEKVLGQDYGSMGFWVALAMVVVYIPLLGRLAAAHFFGKDGTIFGIGLTGLVSVALTFAAICMVHVSRLAEEIVLWMSQNFGFIDLADRYCTGSSIMPQKRNPDVAELARGKTGRVVGHLMGLLTLMKGQPLTYNKDNQEDKEPLFDTVDTLRDTLRIMAEMCAGIVVKAEAMERAALRGYATATDLADYLVKKGLPFRDAHEAVAHAVKVAIQQGVDLSQLPLATLQDFHPAISVDVFDALTLRGSMNARNVRGGTAPAQVRLQIERHRGRLAVAV
jgi:argininosuccinate lyase